MRENVGRLFSLIQRPKTAIFRRRRLNNTRRRLFKPSLALAKKNTLVDEAIEGERSFAGSSSKSSSAPLHRLPDDPEYANVTSVLDLSI